MVIERVYLFAGRIEGVTPGPRLRAVDIIADLICRSRGGPRGVLYAHGVRLRVNALSGEFLIDE